MQVSDGYITFCKHFKYLGMWVSYSLWDDYDISKRIAAANAAMGALEKFWIDGHVDMYSKYMIFRAIPCNLLLCGCESWALRQSLLDLLEVFLHCNIRRILGISMVKVREMKINNTQVRSKSYNIP